MTKKAVHMKERPVLWPVPAVWSNERERIARWRHLADGLAAAAAAAQGYGRSQQSVWLSAASGPVKCSAPTSSAVTPATPPKYTQSAPKRRHLVIN